MKKSRNDTWIGYLGSLKNKNFTPELLKPEGMEKWPGFNEHFHSAFRHSIPLVYLLDYTSGKYLSVSQSSKWMLGYEPEKFLDGGVGFTLEKYNSDDLRLFNEQIFPDRLKLLKSVPPEDHPRLIFSYNLRIMNKEGRPTNLLQRNCFLRSDEKGNPLLSLGMIINIDDYKAASPVIQVVEKLDPNQPMEMAATLQRKTYFIHEEDSLFSPREKEILAWIADGLTSKEIARKLFLSEYTIINHRKNMQAKSNTRNATELVSFAIRQRII